MEKTLYAVNNLVGGYDLMTERDGGNLVRILTGNKSLEYWEQMKNLCENVIDNIKYGIEEEIVHP